MGIFPNAASALRLIGAILEEQGDAWLAVRRYFGLGSMAVLYAGSPQHPEVPALEVPKEVIAAQLVTIDEEPLLHHLTERDPLGVATS